LAGGPVLSEVNFASGLPDWFPVSKGNMQSLVADRYHYIKNGDGHEELYDFENDRWEKHDLSRSGEGHQVLARYRVYLEAFLQFRPKSVLETNAAQQGRKPLRNTGLNKQEVTKVADEYPEGTKPLGTDKKK